MKPFQNPPFVKILNQAKMRFTQNVYRITILNAFFKAYFTDLQFFVYSPNNQTSKGILSFTIIGTDSTILAQPVYNVSDFFLSSAERVDMLLDFNIPLIEVGDLVSLEAVSSFTEVQNTQYVNFTIGPRI
jgi:hypothetical protein